MATRPRIEAAARRMRALAYAGLDSVELRQAGLRELAAAVPFDGGFFPTADPATLLYTSAVRVDMPDGVTAPFLDNEFRRADVNKFRSLAASATGAATLDEATAGDRSRSARYREIMAPAGLGDELRVVFRTGALTWGFACLHRAASAPPFAPEEVALLRALSPHLAEGLRRSVMAARGWQGAADDGPGVVTLADDRSVLAATPAGERWLDDLADAERPRSKPVPVAVLAVADTLDRLDATGRVPALTARAASGRWLVLHASHLRSGAGSQVVVVIEPASGPVLEPMVVAGYQLTAREAETLTLVLRGLPTKAIAAELRVTINTANDHIKAIFAKTGVSSRGELMATVFQDLQRARP